MQTKSSSLLSLIPGAFRLGLGAAVVLLPAGCTAINDSGVPLHRKPDLSMVIPGTPADRVAALKSPAKKEPLDSANARGPEVWLYEWDAPDDEVNNKMFTAVVVKEGFVLGYAEDTPDKWARNPELHRMAKSASAREDAASRSDFASGLPSHGRDQLKAGGMLLPTARERGAAAADAGAQSDAGVQRDWRAQPYGRYVGPVRALLAKQTPPTPTAREESIPYYEEGPAAPGPAPSESVRGDTAAENVAANATPPAAVSPAVPPKRTLAELEAEELRIRKDSSLTKKERMQKLREIWKLQLAVTGEKSA